jgi:copper transport protein
MGPLRAVSDERRTKLLGCTVRRFSKVATLAVMSLLVTGLYAILLHVPTVSALIGTPYGRTLLVKLGLLVPLLAAGGINLVARGRGPFDRVVRFELILAVFIFVVTGFLTTLPPASAVSP